MIKVTLRQKSIEKGKRKSLYLDIYPPIPHPITHKLTRHYTLKLYLYSRPKDSNEKLHNDETRQLADSIRSKRQLEIQAGSYDFLVKSSERNFLKFFEEAVKKEERRFEKDERKASSYRMRKSAYEYFSNYCGGSCPFSQLTEEYAKNFQTFLLEQPKLSQNTASQYFKQFKSVYNGAGALVPDLNIKHIPQIDSDREFLSYEELNKLFNTPYDAHPDIRSAGIFAALTGLRYSDIVDLHWSEFRYSEKTGHFIKFRIKKTGYPDVLPISPQAREVLTANDSDKVFPNLHYPTVNSKIPVWVALAGITRHITFHCFRHTFATLQLTLGTDIYTISKMLGHKNLKTTQIYAKLVDAKKQEAANKIILTPLEPPEEA